MNTRPPIPVPSQNPGRRKRSSLWRFILVAGVLVYWLTGGEKKEPEPRSTKSIVNTHVRGSPDFPYVQAVGSSHVDAVLDLVIVHQPSGTREVREIRMTRNQNANWQKRPELVGYAANDWKTLFFGDTIGVEVSLNYSENRNGSRIFEDRSKILIPFATDENGVQGPFVYKATWRKGALASLVQDNPKV